MKKLIYPLIFVFIIMSCKDKELPTTPFSSLVQNSYFPITVGSYWVYDFYVIEFDTDTTKYSNQLTISVEKDTLIDNVLFSKFISKKENGSIYDITFYSFSFNEVYDQNGIKKFSSTDFSDTLSFHTILDRYETIYSMKRNPKIINTEIGELICLEKHGSHKNFVTLLSEGQTSDYYSQGIGLVIFENYGLPYSLKHHYRLVDYHIE